MRNFAQMFLEREKTMKDAKEVWRTSPDCPFIEASNLGRVRTKDRYVKVKGRGKRFVKGRVLKQNINKDGYMRVQFCVNGKEVRLYVHRIVATCFIPNPNNLPEVNHIDNDRTNNAANNLEWCTHEWNIDYRKECGTSASKLFGRPVIAVNLDTCEVFWFESQREAARQLNVNAGHINSVIKGRLKKTCDYWFCYADKNAVEKVRSKFGDEVANKVEKLIDES